MYVCVGGGGGVGGGEGGLRPAALLLVVWSRLPPACFSSSFSDLKH